MPSPQLSDDLKHANRSSDWYNRRAVEQLRTKNAGLSEVAEAGED